MVKIGEMWQGKLGKGVKSRKPGMTWPLERLVFQEFRVAEVGFEPVFPALGSHGNRIDLAGDASISSRIRLH
jgi:hypothetical protein